MTDKPEDPIKAAQAVADRLDERGHGEHAGNLRAAMGHGQASAIVRAALGEACQVILTAIEAIDPVCATMVEDLRLKIDAWVEPRPVAGHP